MRKLTSKEEEKRKEKRNRTVLGIILVFVMFGSVFGIVVGSFGSSSTQEKIIYKGQEFKLLNNYYVFEIGDYSFYFLSDPRNFLEIESEVEVSRVLTSFTGKVLYLDSIDPYSSQDISQNLYPYVERIHPACLNESTCLDSSLPIKDCTNNFIIIKESEVNKIYEEENCIFIEGKREDLIKLTDELLLRLIGFN